MVREEQCRIAEVLGFASEISPPRDRVAAAADTEAKPTMWHAMQPTSWSLSFVANADDLRSLRRRAGHPAIGERLAQACAERRSGQSRLQPRVSASAYRAAGGV